MRCENRFKGNAKSEEISDERLRESLRLAMETLKLLPMKMGDKPIPVTSSWGEFNQQNRMADLKLRKPLKRKPNPKEISVMNFWLDQLQRLPPQNRRIVMARACGYPWRRLEEIDGRSHTTLRKIEQAGLSILRANMNKSKVDRI